MHCQFKIKFALLLTFYRARPFYTTPVYAIL